MKLMAVTAMVLTSIDCINRALGFEEQHIFAPALIWLWWIPATIWLLAAIELTFFPRILK